MPKVSQVAKKGARVGIQFLVPSLILFPPCSPSRQVVENEALSYGIKVYTYKVLSKELAYRKLLVDVTFLMKVRQM